MITIVIETRENIAPRVVVSFNRWINSSKFRFSTVVGNTFFALPLIFRPSPQMFIFRFLRLHRPQRRHDIEFSRRSEVSELIKTRRLTLDSQIKKNRCLHRKASFTWSVSTIFVVHRRLPWLRCWHCLGAWCRARCNKNREAVCVAGYLNGYGLELYFDLVSWKESIALSLCSEFAQNEIKNLHTTTCIVGHLCLSKWAEKQR